MRVRILDLDGGVLPQAELCARHQPTIHDMRDWGPLIRMGCSFRRFRRFEDALGERLAAQHDREPALTFYGSGDFHHVSLALLRRLQAPCNLLILDNHPDWMRGIPFLHCGTWVHHAARLPNIQRIFHVGGDVDFDNAFRWLTPWPLLRSGKVTVFPAIRRYQRGPWRDIPHHPLRRERDAAMTPQRLEDLLEPFRAALAHWPLYVSLDKDVLVQDDALVNWDSGHLRLAEVRSIVETFLRAAAGRLAGMDLLGEWSPVRMSGLFRHFLHLTEHPTLHVDPAEATRTHERANLALLDSVLNISADVSS